PGVLPSKVKSEQRDKRANRLRMWNEGNYPGGRSASPGQNARVLPIGVVRGLWWSSRGPSRVSARRFGPGPRVERGYHLKADVADLGPRDRCGGLLDPLPARGLATERDRPFAVHERQAQWVRHVQLAALPQSRCGPLFGPRLFDDDQPAVGLRRVE